MARRCTTEGFKLLTDLKKLGYTHKGIRGITNIPVGTLSGFKLGAEPRHSDGERLIRLWCDATGAEREDAPRVTRRSFHF